MEEKAAQLARLRRSMAEDDFNVYFDDASARLGHAVSLGQGTVRSLFLVNGGAIIALLTLVGNASATVENRALFYAFVWFGVGLFLALLASLAFPLSQMFYMQSSNTEGWKAQAEKHGQEYPESGDRDDVRGEILLTSTIVLAFLSIVFFIIGSFVALDAIT